MDNLLTFRDDESYLQETETLFFVKNLFLQVATFRPEDSLDYALRYFKTVRSCHNVLGADFNFINGSNRNKRAFVFCLMELFKTFTDNEEMSINEYQHIIEMICPNFPSSIMPAVVSSLEVVNASASPPKYRHGDMCISLYFHIIYDEWLKYIMTIFKEEGSLECLSLFRLHAYIQDCRKNNRISYPQPPAECIDSAFADSKSQEISYFVLKKMLFEDKLVRKDLTGVRKYMTSLVNTNIQDNLVAPPSTSPPTDRKEKKEAMQDGEIGPSPSSAPITKRTSNRISAVTAVNAPAAQGHTSNPRQARKQSSGGSDDDDEEGDRNST